MIGFIATLAAVTAKEAWYERAADSLPRVGELLTALLGAIALVGLARSVYRRTLGRRRDRYERLRRLGANAQLSFFSSVLGEPPAMRRSFEGGVTQYDDQSQPFRVAKRFIEAVYIDRDFYVHAIADEEETVHAYSVTTRSKRFRPTFRPPGGHAVERSRLLQRLGFDEYGFRPQTGVTLGKTRFAELERPSHAAAWIGAHNWHYFEAFYFGNPGYYQYFIYSINDAGARGFGSAFDYEFMRDFSWGFTQEVLDPRLSLVEAAVEADARLERNVEESSEADEEVDPLGFEPADPPLPPQWVAFRRHARVNTYSIIGSQLALDDYPLAGERLDHYPTAFGVNSARVRTIDADTIG